MNAHAAKQSAWARPGLHAQVVRTRHDGRHEAALRVDGLDDAYRVLQLESRLKAHPGIHRLALDVRARRLRVSWDPAHTHLPAVLHSCAAGGCPARPLPVDMLDNPRRREAHDALKHLVVAGLFAMQAMMFASVLYIGQFETVDATTTQLFRWLGLLAATPVVTWAALPLYRQALVDLRQRRLGIETTVTVAVLLIFLASVHAAWRGQGLIYFDSVSMFVFVLLAGRYAEMRARHHNGAGGEAVAEATPVAAERRDDDGALELVAIAELRPGDRVHVAEGDVVPADGVLDMPRARLNEALLSGEPNACERLRGEPVVAGSVAVDGPVDMRVTRVAARSTLGALGALAARAGTLRQDRQRDRSAARFSVCVLSLAGLTALGWLLYDPTRAFEAAVTVLVVACPCAFALAAPTMMSRVLRVLAQSGVLAVRPEALHVLPHVDLALFDKTGTLTTPYLDPCDIVILREAYAADVLPWAAALARASRHPLARLIVAAAAHGSIPEARDVQVVAGGGIRGWVAGRDLRLGHAGFVDLPDTHPFAGSSLLLADADGLLAVFPVHERPRADAASTLQALRGEGVALEILSGDAAARVAATARALRVPQWQSRLLPADKLSCLGVRHERGAVVLAVGDGSNDAPLLAAADVSAALVGGTELAQARADLLLVDGLHGLPRAISVARQAQVLLRQNRRWALAYNLCAVPFAALGMVPPWLAVLGMAASSLLVVLHTLRIRPSAAGPQLEPGASSPGLRENPT